jgi:hypothetical protein
VSRAQAPAAAFILFVGMAFGAIAFRVTAGPPSVDFGRIFCTTVEDEGFDPWTGFGHGRLRRCALPAEGDAPRIWKEFREDPPIGALGIPWAVPFTIGGPVGCLLAGGAMDLGGRLRARRRR